MKNFEHGLRKKAGKNKRFEISKINFPVSRLRHTPDLPFSSNTFFDPPGRPTVTAGSDDHCFRTCCPSVCTSPLFKICQNITYLKRKQCLLMASRDCVSGRVDHGPFPTNTFLLRKFKSWRIHLISLLFLNWALKKSHEGWIRVKN